MNTKKTAGGISTAIIAVFIAIIIVINVLAGLLPENLTQLDISASRLYSVTANTKVVLSNLEEDVTVYWLTQSGEEDDVIEKLLAKYDSLSSHLEVVKKDPDVYPTFAQQYTDGEVSNNDVIVECGDKYRYITYSDIYETDNVDYYTGSYDYYFDGEGEITSAINYVTTDNQSIIYRLTGHGETDLSSKFTSQIARENMELKDFTLLNVESIPDDCDAVLVYGPTSDISDVELGMLRDYVQGGGKLIVFCGPQQEETLPNFHALIESYGVKAEEGILVETNRDYYFYNMPYVLLPTMESDDITDEMIEEDDYVILPLTQGLNLDEASSGVTSLLDSSDDAINKSAGYSFTSYELEDGDTQGCFSLAVKIEDGDGELIWIASSFLLDDTYNSYSSGANLDFAMNCLSDMVGGSSNISIRSKSLNYEYLTISNSEGNFLKMIMIVAVPLVFVVFGIIEIIQRRRLR